MHLEYGTVTHEAQVVHSVRARLGLMRWGHAQALQVQAGKGEDLWKQQLCTAAAACLQHMCQHTDARPAVQAAGAIPLLAQLCDLDRWSVQVVRYASAALASIAVGPDVKVC